MNKIVFLDLDGTLWTFEQIPDSALLAIAQARKNGHKILTNTGRSRCEVSQALWDLKLDGYCFSAGSEIYLESNRILYEPLGAELVKQIQTVIEEIGIGYSLEGSDMTFTNSVDREQMKAFAQTNRVGSCFLDFPDVSTIQEKDYDQIMKISLRAENEEDLDYVLSRIPDCVEFTRFRGFGGELTLKKYNKATAIQFLEQYFNNEYESMAFGDSDNDLPMLKYASISVAMGNGTDSVKEISSYITDPIDENGIYNAFKHFELI